MEIVSLYFPVEAKLVLRFPHCVCTVLLISSLGWIRKGGREKNFNLDFETRQVVFGVKHHLRVAIGFYDLFLG